MRHWLDSTAGIILITYFWKFPQHIPKMILLNEAACYEAVVFHGGKGRKDFSWLNDIHEFFDCLHILLRITDNSAAVSTGDFLRQFKTVGCRQCWFNCILRFHNGKAQFYITDLELLCDDHVRLFCDITTISTPRSTNLCSKQSCLKHLRYLGCFATMIVQAFKADDLGAFFKNCDYLETIHFERCGDAIGELLDHIPNSNTCSLKLDCFDFRLSDFGKVLTSVGAEKLAGVLPRFNITILHLELHYCCAAAVHKLVCSITHKTLQELTLRHVRLTPAAAAALGRSLPKMSSLVEFELTGVNRSILQVEEMEALFGGINETFSALEVLTLSNFNARGSLAPLTKRVHFFPKLTQLNLSSLNMDERDLHGLLESLRSFPKPPILDLHGNPLGSWYRLQSMVQQALPLQFALCY